MARQPGFEPKVGLEPKQIPGPLAAQVSLGGRRFKETDFRDSDGHILRAPRQQDASEHTIGIMLNIEGRYCARAGFGV